MKSFDLRGNIVVSEPLDEILRRPEMSNKKIIGYRLLKDTPFAIRGAVFRKLGDAWQSLEGSNYIFRSATIISFLDSYHLDREWFECIYEKQKSLEERFKNCFPEFDFEFRGRGMKPTSKIFFPEEVFKIFAEVARQHYKEEYLKAFDEIIKSSRAFYLSLRFDQIREKLEEVK